MRIAVAVGLLFLILVLTFGVSGVALADQSLSVEHTTPFAGIGDADTEADDDRTISGETIDGDVEAAGDVVITDGSSISGDVEAGGDVTIIDSTVDGDVEADGDVTVEGSTIDGDVEADGDVTVEGSKVDGDVEADGDVTVAGSTVDGDVEADGDILIEADSRILGDVDAARSVELADESRILGDVDAGGDVIISTHSEVDGDIDADGDVIDENEQAVPELSDLHIAGQGAEATITEGDDEDVSIVVANVGDADGAFEVTVSVGDWTDTQVTGTIASGDSETVSFDGITGDLDVGGYDVIASTVDDEMSGVLQVEAADDHDVQDKDDTEAAEPISVLSQLDIAGQGADATITEGASEGLRVEVENVGEAPGSFDVTLTIGDTVERTENTDELAAGETKTVTFSDVTSGLVADGYAVAVSTANDTVTGTLAIQTDEQEDDREDGEQESDGDGDEQESDGDGDDQESGGDGDDQESGSDGDDQESDSDEDEREGTFEISTVSLSNTVITAGESLQIGLQIENVGDKDGTFVADLVVNGEIVDSMSVTIQAGGTGTIAFSYQFDDPGEYEIAVGDRLLDTVTVRPADEDESETERGGDDATAIEIVRATVPADWVREGFETSVRVTVENTANRTATRTLTVTIDDQPVANETVTLRAYERDEVRIVFEATAGSVAVDGVEAGWIDTSGTDTGDVTEEDDTEVGAGFGFEVGIAAFLVIVGILAGVALLKPPVIVGSM